MPQDRRSNFVSAGLLLRTSPSCPKGSFRLPLHRYFEYQPQQRRQKFRTADHNDLHSVSPYLLVLSIDIPITISRSAAHITASLSEQTSPSSNPNPNAAAAQHSTGLRPPLRLFTFLQNKPISSHPPRRRPVIIIRGCSKSVKAPEIHPLFLSAASQTDMAHTCRQY